MKKLIYYISALALCTLSFTSCSDLLDEDPKSDIRENQYMNNAAEQCIVRSLPQHGGR